MRDGFRTLINPGSRISEVDLEATRASRERLHDEIRNRNYIVRLMVESEPGGDGVRVTPYVVHGLPEAEPASIGELFDLTINEHGASA